MDRATNDLTIVIACDCETDTAEFNEVFSGSREGAMPSELSLMAAVLSFAIYEKDLEWINGDDYSEHPFSFRNCCEYLGIDHLAARKVLNQRLSKCRGVLFRQPKPRLKLEIRDLPGKEYTHAYDECPPGVNPSRCPECRQRYNAAYARGWRQSSRSRTPIVAQLTG
jgi:hypothetical protein